MRRARSRSSRPTFAGAEGMARRDDARARWRGAFGFGTYRAANYDELIDHPVEMAPFALVSFDAGGARHDIAVTGRIRADLDRVARDLARICQWQIDLFAGAPGGRAPFDRYLFQVAAVGDGYGGLEHRASTSLLCRRDELPARATPGVSEGYRNFLGLASHEYFHSWNVKRIKPAAFVAVRPRARELHAAAVGVRGHHVLLRRPRARAERRDRAAVVSRAAGPRDHDGAAHAGTPPAERRRVELRRMDQVLPSGREHAERRRQLLREGLAGRARARSRAARVPDRRSTP